MIYESALRSKTTLVLDENLYGLKDALEDTGFKVIIPKSGLSDENIIQFLTGKIIITQNSKDFLMDALVHDFDIVSMEAVKFIDTKKDRTNVTAKQIHEAIKKSKITTLRGNWILKIQVNNYKLTEIK